MKGFLGAIQRLLGGGGEKEKGGSKGGGSGDGSPPKGVAEAKAPKGELHAPEAATIPKGSLGEAAWGAAANLHPSPTLLREMTVLEPEEEAGEALTELLRRQRRLLGSAQRFGEEI